LSFFVSQQQQKMPPKARAEATKAAAEERAAHAAAAAAEAREQTIWSVGAKDQSKAAAAAAAEEEKRRKAAEKAALLAAEEAEMSGVKREVKTKKKGKDDLDMLNAALATMPKTKAQKEAEAKKKAADEQKAKEAKAREEKEARAKAEQDGIKAAAAKGLVLNHSDELMVKINNRLEEDDFEDATGLDGALDVLSMGGGGQHDEHPERRQKALYNAYYEAQLPLMREEHPGLKLSQYKERIFDAWKTSPENPHNQKA